MTVHDSVSNNFKVVISNLRHDTARVSVRKCVLAGCSSAIKLIVRQSSYEQAFVCAQ